MQKTAQNFNPQESDRLFDVLRRLADDGCAVLYISHKLDEIMALTSKATILRGGKNVGDVIPTQSSTREMAEMMVGDKVDWIERRTTASDNTAETIFAVSGLNRPQESAFATSLLDIDFDVHAGEILGIAGISGNGQEELVEVLTGEWLCPDRQQINFKGQAIGKASPEARRRLGIEMVPEERNGHAAIPEMSLIENTFLTHYNRQDISGDGTTPPQQLMRHPQLCAETTSQIIADHDVRTPHSNPMARQLSGGNLQKFIMGRSLITAPELMIIAQPTWGVDVGAATMIRHNILALAAKGCGIVLISQDLEEIFSLSTRIAVLNEGRLSAVHDAIDLSAEDVGLLMGGKTKTANPDKAIQAKAPQANGGVA